ncbi:MAG: glycosyltransferase [Luteibacter sp.]|uniref:glycosyltransferase n=1 Tax=Luteibacter sp. TaxID=1886636 RepID=UPI0028090327|nr:glycosyltransferase [Luteibacter sp.]MDQ7997238.1 glycosyltransferase [Luteibacter sp.]
MTGFTTLRTNRWTGPSMETDTPPVVVAIPVRNEAENIAGCLDALARMDRRGIQLLAVILVFNGCSDTSWETASACWGSTRLPLRLIEVALDPALNHAGGARAAALSLALTALGERRGGTILTTDADSRVPREWMVQIQAMIDGGADAVAGEITVDETAAVWPESLRSRHRIEAEYASLLDEIDALCDPVPHNPWPRHRRCSGANLAFRADALRELRALPAPPYGEDRALVDACLARDLSVRHAPSPRVETSSRLTGRASGGMADTLSDRSRQHDLPCDAMIEACSTHVYRATQRARARRTFMPGVPDAALAHSLGLPAHQISGAPSLHFGDTWQWLERCSPSLARVPLSPGDLPHEITKAKAWLATRLSVTRKEIPA